MSTQKISTAELIKQKKQRIAALQDELKKLNKKRDDRLTHLKILLGAEILSAAKIRLSTEKECEPKIREAIKALTAEIITKVDIKAFFPAEVLEGHTDNAASPSPEPEGEGVQNDE